MSTIIPSDKLWNIRSNMFEMFEDRKYNLHPDLFVTRTTFLMQHRKELESECSSRHFCQSMHFIINTDLNVPNAKKYVAPHPIVDSDLIGNVDAIKIEGNVHDMLVVFFKEASVNVEAVRILNSYVKTMSVNQILCVCDGKLNPLAMKELNEHNPSKFIQVMYTQQLGHNLARHVLNPFFVILSTDEANEFYKKHHLLPHQIPVYFDNDKYVQWYGCKPGQLIKLTRRSALLQPEYRRVCSKHSSETALSIIPAADSNNVAVPSNSAFNL